MLHFDLDRHAFVGTAGVLPVPTQDECAVKFAMLLEGDCLGLGPKQAAAKFGFSEQRYFQLRHLLHAQGTQGLVSRKRGPKACSRRTHEVVRQIIRQRFLDPDASADVIAQKLRQTGFAISTRSVERTIEQFGLQKKTPSLPPPSGTTSGNPEVPVADPKPTLRSRQSGTRRPSTSGR